MFRSSVEHGCRNTWLFSFTTQKEVLRTYRRMFDPIEGVSPPQHRIVLAIKKVVYAMEVTHEHRGAFVPGLAGG